MDQQHELTCEIIEAGFMRLIGNGWKYPNETRRYRFSVLNYQQTLSKHFTPSQYLEAVEFWVASPSGWWPRAGELIEIWKINQLSGIDLEVEFGRIRRIIKSLPGFYGSEHSRKQQISAWNREIQRKYPDGLPKELKEGLEAVGGWSEIKRKMGAEGTYEMNQLQRTFIKAVKSKFQGAPKQLETTQHQRRITNGS